MTENPDDPAAPIAYLPVEFHFPAGETFKHFDMKWENCLDMNCIPVTDARLIERLQEMSKKVFLGVEGVSYGRCDIRMNEAGELFILEINPNCGLFYPPEAMGSADLILLAKSTGSCSFYRHDLACSAQAWPQKRKKWQVVLNSAQRYGMYANHTIPTVKSLNLWKSTPMCWSANGRCCTTGACNNNSGFHYAYPITDEIYVMWSNDRPMKPTDHSCDPNTWLDGLNLVARRRIEPGEQITIDYGAFRDETMEEFACTCGAPTCRGVIHGGNDYQQAFISQNMSLMLLITC